MAKTVQGECMRERLARFMAGRNGNDQLNIFLLVVDLVLLLLGSFFSKSIGGLCFPLALVLLLYIYFRMFSRNVYRRREENGKYLRLRYKVSAELRMRRERWLQRRDYKFFVCPSCRTHLRVPRGQGRIKIVCRKCGNSFLGKS